MWSVRNSNGNTYSTTAPLLQTSDFVDKWVHIHIKSRKTSETATQCIMVVNNLDYGSFNCGSPLGPDVISGSNLIFGDVPNVNQMVAASLYQNPMDFEVDRVLVYRGTEPSALYWDSIKPNC
jgi:hypothetical protein